MHKTIVLLLLGALVYALPGFADEVRDERVQFQHGTSGATIEDSIKGYASVNYQLGAKAGQSMVVILTTDHGATYFNIFAPGTKPGEDEAMYIGSTNGNRYEGELPADGDYMIQVYMMRSAARRNEVSQYKLDIGID